MLEQSLRQICRQWLEDGTVKVVIGYGDAGPERPARPIFVASANGVDKLVWNSRCEANLAVYLKRKEIRELGKAAIVVKACDERALNVLRQENQLDRESLAVIGVACDGSNSPNEKKCERCDSRVPRFADAVVGEPGKPPEASGRAWAELEELLAKSPAERMAYWQKEFSRCVKCYACRQACPLCYCERCVADKNRPTSIAPSPTLKGNFAWHITRAFHLAGRCVGCDACVRACPVGINLRLLNLSMAKVAEESFGHRSGADPSAEPLIGACAPGDREDFIR